MSQTAPFGVEIYIPLVLERTYLKMDLDNIHGTR
jgi:hypothetical protein